MNKAIWKFPLSVLGESMIEMPKGAAVLTVQAQRNEPMIWAEVDPNAQNIKRRFVSYGTGHGYDGDGLSYVGTYQINGGEFVFHVFTDRIEYTD